MSEDTMWLYVISLVVILLILVYFTRWIFKVSKTEAYQRSSLALLKEIALKQGVEEENVNQAMSYFRKEEES